MRELGAPFRFPVLLVLIAFSGIVTTVDAREEARRIEEPRGAPELIVICVEDADCDDGIDCTIDTCEAGICVHEGRDGLCDDGFECTRDFCESDFGCHNEPEHDRCSDGIDCTLDRCNPGSLIADPVTGCENDAQVALCDDGIDCTLDECLPEEGGCRRTPRDFRCDDGVGCTSERCSPTEGCVIETLDARCDDGVACTSDRCDASLDCLNVPDDGVCDDGIDCTSERCDVAAGCVVTENDDRCDDGVDCTQDRCEAGQGCVSDPDDAFCADGLFCTGMEVCDPSSPLRDGAGCVDAGVPCTDQGERCVEEEERCAEEACRDGVDNDGDGNLDCGDEDCPGFTPEDCDDGIDNDCDGKVDCEDEDCNEDRDGDGHVAEPCGRDCDDEDAGVNPGRAEDCESPEDDNCNGLTNCAEATCRVDADGDGQFARPCGEDCDDTDPEVRARRDELCGDGKDNDCDDQIDCADGECAGRSCDDEVGCTTGDTCTDGACVGTVDHGACDDGVFCTVDRCDPVTGCTNAASHARCDDLLFCDGAEVCDPADAEADAAGCVDGVDPCGTDPCDEANDTCDCAVDAHEPDDLCGQARRIEVDEVLRSREHTLCPERDVDRVVFDVVAGMQYRFFTTGEVDTMGIVRDTGCVQELARNNDCSEEDANFCLVFTAQSTGQRILEVRSGATQPAAGFTTFSEEDGGDAPSAPALEGEEEGTTLAKGGGFVRLAAETGAYTLWYQTTQGGCSVDGFEPGDGSCGSATFIAPGASPATENHSLCPPGDRDRWRFFGTAGRTYRFATAGGTDTVVEVRTDDCATVLSSSSDCGGSPSACLEYTAPVDSFYTVEVRGETGTEQGDYQFVHQRLDGGTGCEPDSAEPDGCAEAFAITPGASDQVLARTLCPRGDRDHFVFTAQAGEIFRFATEGGLDTRILVGTASCAQALAMAESCGQDGINACLEWEAPAAGTYKVRVEGRTGSETGPYDFVHSKAGCPEDAFEPDGRCDLATDLVVRAETRRESHTICPAGEVDLWRFFAQEGVTYRFSSEGTTDMGGAVLDDDCNTFLVKDESSGAEENFDLFWTAPRTDVFHFGVTGDGGPYELVYRTVDGSGTVCEPDGAEQDDVCSLATVIVPSSQEQTLERSLCPPGDRDHFVFEATAGTTYRFWTTGHTDTACNVRDAGCVRLAGNDDRDLPSDLNCFLEWTAPSDGTFHFRVRGFSRTQTVGEYTVHHEIAP